MNGVTTERRIEIFAPFEAAFALTKLILFQPFDFGKWCVIGFAAFLAHLAGGGNHFNYSRRFNASDWNWNFRSTTHDAMSSAGGIPGWAIPLIIFLGLVVLAIGLVLLWLGARGKFIFTDCIVRNRGRIVEPWHEFRKEGNSYFLFSLLVLVLVLVVLGLAGLPLLLPLAAHHEFPTGVGLILGATFFGLTALCLVVVVSVITSFMVPVMYRRRCGAAEAFKAALDAVMEHLGPVILYLLFSIVLWIAFGLIACLTTCLTCCITAIPYVGTVILLPAYVFFASYLLLFVRQFGPEYDAWANIISAAPATPAIETTLPPPTITPEPPPTEPPLPPVQT